MKSFCKDLKEHAKKKKKTIEKMISLINEENKSYREQKRKN